MEEEWPERKNRPNHKSGPPAKSSAPGTEKGSSAGKKIQTAAHGQIDFGRNEKYSDGFWRKSWVEESEEI